MSTQDFTALKVEIEAASKEIEEANAESPFHFLGDFYSDIDSFLLSLLDNLEQICVDPALRPSEKAEGLKNSIFNELEDIRKLRESLHSDDIPTELFFLLEDIKKDLDITEDIGLQPESKFLIYRININFQLLNRITFWGDIDEELTKSQVIQFPRSEFRRPLNYSLLVHECFHVKENLISSIREKVDELESIPSEKQEEVCVDLASLNYIGPAYGYSLSRIPDKIGKHQSISHPEYQTRLRYIYQYLEYIEGKQVDDDYNEVVLTRSEDDVKREIEGRLEDERDSTYIDHFDEIQQCIEQIFDDHNIPTYVSERGYLEQYLSMPEASPQKVSDNLDRFLLANPGNEIALPVKPILLFNLLLAVEEHDKKDLESVVLPSFKKWYVTRITREQKGQDVTNSHI